MHVSINTTENDMMAAIGTAHQASELHPSEILRWANVAYPTALKTSGFSLCTHHLAPTSSTEETG